MAEQIIARIKANIECFVDPSKPCPEPSKIEQDINKNQEEFREKMERGYNLLVEGIKNGELFEDILEELQNTVQSADTKRLIDFLSIPASVLDDMLRDEKFKELLEFITYPISSLPQEPGFQDFLKKLQEWFGLRTPTPSVTVPSSESIKPPLILPSLKFYEGKFIRKRGTLGANEGVYAATLRGKPVYIDKKTGQVVEPSQLTRDQMQRLASEFTGDTIDNPFTNTYGPGYPNVPAQQTPDGIAYNPFGSPYY